LGSHPLIIEEELRQKFFHPDFLEDYDGAKEEIGDGLPEAFGQELETSSVFFDADHAHDHQTQRSITGIIVFVGSTPVLWPSKRQGCIATLTYTAEFVAIMRSAILARGGNLNPVHVALLGHSGDEANKPIWS
jgi:hypothetical protein